MLMHIIYKYYTMLVSHDIRYQRAIQHWHSYYNPQVTMRWAALLSNWTLSVVQQLEDEICGTLAAIITPPEEVDKVLTAITLITTEVDSRYTYSYS